MDAHPRVVVRSEAQAIVGHGSANTERGPPAVVPGDVRLSDICQRRLDLEETESRQEQAIVRERDAVFRTPQPEGHQQRQIPPVNSVGKTFGHDGSHPLSCMSATEPRYCPISTLHRKLRQELGAEGGPARPSLADFAPSQGSISTRSKRNSSSTHPFPILARSWLSAEVLPGCGLMSDGLRRRASTSRASARTDLARLPRATDGEPSIVPGASSEPGQWRVIEDDYLGAFVGSGSWCAACVHGGTVHGPGGSSGGGPARRARMPARAVPRRGPSGRSCAGRGWAAILRRSSGL